MKGVREAIVAGLRFKLTQAGEYTTFDVRDGNGKVVFMGTLIFKFWPKLRAGFEIIKAE